MNKEYFVVYIIATTISVIAIIILLTKFLLQIQVNKYKDYLDKIKDRVYYKDPFSATNDLNLFGEHFREMVKLITHHTNYKLVCLFADYLDVMKKVLNLHYEHTKYRKIADVALSLEQVGYTSNTKSMLLKSKKECVDEVMLLSLYKNVSLGLHESMITHFKEEVDEILQSRNDLETKVFQFLDAFEAFEKVESYLSARDSLRMVKQFTISRFSAFLEHQLEHKEISDEVLINIHNKINNHRHTALRFGKAFPMLDAKVLHLA